MIEISIKRKLQVEYKEWQNFQVTSKPTTITKQKTYGEGSEVCYETTSEPKEITKTKQVEQTLLFQEVEDSTFNIIEVIQAINGIKK